jgi:N-acetylmuramoyl-L-alanine amidase
LLVNEPHIHENPLSYVSSLEDRAFKSIDLVVIHCTELPDLATAREYGQRIQYSETGTGNSGHYYIERDGRIEQWAPTEKIAHHVRGFNERSIGIELDNNGRYPDWFDSRKQVMTEAYPVPQINSLVGLLLHLISELPNLEWIAGHASLDTSRVPATDRPDLQIYRKRDPGALFPWKELLPIIQLRRLVPD